jgi:hypothetical protein
LVDAMAPSVSPPMRQFGQAGHAGGYEPLTFEAMPMRYETEMEGRRAEAPKGAAT